MIMINNTDDDGNIAEHRNIQSDIYIWSDDNYDDDNKW